MRLCKFGQIRVLFREIPLLSIGDVLKFKKGNIREGLKRFTSVCAWRAKGLMSRLKRSKHS